MDMIRRMLMIASILVASTSTPYAYFMSGNKLQELCHSTGQGWAGGFVQGVIDTDETIYFANREVSKRFMCVPMEVTVRQATDIVCRSIELKPETRHKAAAILAIEALMKAFPCSK